MPKNYIVGNWKMNQSLEDINSFITIFSESNIKDGNNWIAPQSIHINSLLNSSKETSLKVGSQTVSENDFGAFTGEINSSSLKELGAHFTLVGHSERRTLFNETDSALNAKTKKALDENLIVIFCCGETLEQREENKTEKIVHEQISNGLKEINLKSADQLIVAYEPIWAIGTGKTASPEQAGSVHQSIRNLLNELYPNIGNEMSILYGGSVKPSNINDLLAQTDINGALVGGASLKAESFVELCKAAL